MSPFQELPVGTRVRVWGIALCGLHVSGAIGELRHDRDPSRCDMVHFDRHWGRRQFNHFLPGYRIETEGVPDRCTNVEPGTFNHECSKPATWIGIRPNGSRQAFCDRCKERGSEAQSITQWEPHDPEEVR